MTQPMIRKETERMSPKRKKKNRPSLPPNPANLKESAKKGNLEKGLAALESLWKRGVLPQNLMKHYLMTWLAYENGNVIRLSKTLGLNRNTVITRFNKKAGKRSTVRLRKSWERIGLAKPRTFSERVYEFYRYEIKEPRLSKAESGGLTNLWLMGVPQRVLSSHYVLWSFRKGRGLVEISERLGKSKRTIHRFRAYAVRPGSPALKWLAPMKALKKEWFR